jgi:hypothetical protein
LGTRLAHSPISVGSPCQSDDEDNVLLTNDSTGECEGGVNYIDYISQEHDDDSLTWSDDDLNTPQLVSDLPQFYDLKYCRLQEDLYKDCFSLPSLHTKNFKDFLEFLPQYSEADTALAALLRFKKQAGLSRESGNQLLKLLKTFTPSVPVPSDWRSVNRHVDQKCALLKDTTLRKVVPWPESFSMHLFDEPGHLCPPAGVELLARDLLELIALKLVCPTTQYVNATEMQYDYTPEFLADGTPCTTNLMSSNFAKYSEEIIRTHNPKGVLVPIITYSDGVALGVRNKVSVMWM